MNLPAIAHLDQFPILEKALNYALSLVSEGDKAEMELYLATKNGLQATPIELERIASRLQYQPEQCLKIDENHLWHPEFTKKLGYFDLNKLSEDPALFIVLPQLQRCLVFIDRMWVPAVFIYEEGTIHLLKALDGQIYGDWYSTINTLGGKLL